MSGFVPLIELATGAWPTIFVLDLARYVLTAGSCAVLLRFGGRVPEQRRIQPRRASAADLRREVGYSLATVLLFSLVGLSVFLGSRTGLFRITGGPVPGAARLFLEFGAMVLLHDAYFYWLHRFMHRPRLFRRVHSLHHKSKTPTPWAAYAFAPTEALLEAAILPLLVLVLPVHEVTVLLFVTHMILRNVIGHAGVELFPCWWLHAPLLRHVTTTTHHDLHHSHGNCNFGLYFTWWDRWMGTEHPDYEARFVAITRSSRDRDYPEEETLQ